MTRLFIDEDLSGRDTVTITGDRAHYLLNVLRSAPGDRLIIIDAASRECEATVEECADNEVVVRVLSVRENQAEPGVAIHLYQAILKGKRFDLVVQKCTELGVARIVPVITQRTVVRLDDKRAEQRLSRWRTIALEAARQSGRAAPPEVSPVITWDEALADWRASGVPGLLPYEALAGSTDSALHETLARLKQTSGLAAFIGPEGGFAPVEAEQAMAAGLQPVSLGSRVLRAETAGIALCAVLMYELDRRASPVGAAKSSNAGVKPCDQPRSSSSSAPPRSS